MMKLIRDKIPEIMEKSGVVCNYAAIQNDELYQTLLRQKFVEEVNEFLASGTLEELADVQTVLNALVAAKKMNLKESMLTNSQNVGDLTKNTLVSSMMNLNKSLYRYI